MRSRTWGVTAVLVAAGGWLSGSGPAFAQGATGAAIYAQGIDGKVPACATCHGASGEGLGDFPRLAGLPSSYVNAQLTAYRDGKRPNAVMEALMKPVDTGAMRAVADYIATLSAPYLPAPTASSDVLATGARLVAVGKWAENMPACRDCHGPALLGGGPSIPGIAGQPQTYLLSQLEAYRNGSRPAGPLGIMGKIAARLEPSELAAAATYAASLRQGQDAEAPRGERGSWQPHAQDPDNFEPPPDSALPPRAEDAAAVLLGERIFTDTRKYAPQYSGNALSCRNCHTDRGRNPLSGPVWAAVPVYPQYRPKDRLVNSLAIRIEGCFRYSQNGTPPPADGEEMVALMTYMGWLATGLPIGILPKAAGYPELAAPGNKPDRQRGKAVYAENCALCHGDDGQGRIVAGAQVMPPLWGPQSYNWGAGMHTLDNAAAFVFANMPYGATGSLTPQQAWDVAAWLNSQPRPQDPRFTESVEKTHELYHKNHANEFYGTSPDGIVLGGQ